MQPVDIALIVAVVTASFFVGIIAAMMGVIQQVLNLLDYSAYIQVMQGIIVSGRKSPVVWGFLLIPVGAASLALFVLHDAAGKPAFFWIVLGLILFIAGPVVVSRLGNEPWYDKMMTWRPDQPVPEWEAERGRWFRLNMARFVIGMLACIAFAIALAGAA